jgi:hypothetical protein
MRATMIVIVRHASMVVWALARLRNTCWLRYSSRKRLLKDLMNAFCIDLPGAM